MGKVSTMASFGAKLTNDYWGWDGKRVDGSIVFIGWQDHVVTSATGTMESCLILEGGDPSRHGHGAQERIRHINQLLEENAAGYLVLATAKDVQASPRKIIEIDQNLYTVRLERRGDDVYGILVARNSNPIPLEGEESTAALEQVNVSDDVGDTEKAQLVQARRGQGLFRSRVDLIEPCCRVTGVIDRAHLRASHIKPWCVSANVERLDGNNGLLLSPHIDHLFDRGFISFHDDGIIQISQRLDQGILHAWGIDLLAPVRPFNPRQCHFLAYHRAKVFLQG